MWFSHVFDLVYDEAVGAIIEIGDRVPPTIPLTNGETLRSRECPRQKRVTHFLKALRTEVFQLIVHLVPPAGFYREHKLTPFRNPCCDGRYFEPLSERGGYWLQSLV